MKINIKILLIMFLIFINLLVGGFLLYFIFTIDSPDIYAEITIVDLTSEEINFETKLDIRNPNGFDLIVKDIKVVSETSEGLEFSTFKFKGGKVSANDKQTFSSTKSIELTGNVPRILNNKITVDIGFWFLGVIKKNMPIEALVVVNLDKFLDKLKIPMIVIHAGIEEITEDGLLFNADIEINNTNDIELNIEDIIADLVTEEGINVGKINLKGGVLNPRSKLNLDASGNLLFKALDAKSITINLAGKATAHVAGISQSFNISTSAVFEVPNLSELFNLENESFEFSLAGEFKLRVRGVITTVRFKVYNPSKIPLVAENLICSVHGATGNNKKLITQKEMDSCEIASKNEICIKTKLRIPYIKLLTSGTGRIVPQWFSISIDGDFSFEGTNQSIPISINGYIDTHFFL